MHEAKTDRTQKKNRQFHDYNQIHQQPFHSNKKKQKELGRTKTT